MTSVVASFIQLLYDTVDEHMTENNCKNLQDKIALFFD